MPVKWTRAVEIFPGGRQGGFAFALFGDSANSPPRPASATQSASTDGGTGPSKPNLTRVPAQAAGPKRGRRATDVQHATGNVLACRAVTVIALDGFQPLTSTYAHNGT